jgi:hypothetical protein
LGNLFVSMNRESESFDGSTIKSGQPPSSGTQGIVSTQEDCP